jgi:hypothetical protein
MKGLMKAMVTLLGIATLSGTARAQDARTQIAEGVSFRASSGWVAVEPAYRNASQWIKVKGELKADGQGLERLAHLSVTTEPRGSHEEALGRLREIAAESSAQPTVTTVAGWPAIERREVIVLPQTAQGGEGAKKVDKFHEIHPKRGIEVTVAVAIDALIVRFEGATFSERDAASADEMRRMAESVIAAAKLDPGRSRSEVQDLKKTARPTPKGPGGGGGEVGLRGSFSSLAPAPLEAAGLGTPTSAQVQFGVGELEVAVSNRGKDVVIAANSGFSRSHDGGQTFTFVGGTPGTFPRDGDPSLAVGQSGAFYYAFIGFPDGSPGAGGVTGCTDSVARSTNGGDTFPFLSHAVFCPFTSASLCFPDQEHIGADRWNAPSGDQLYVVWRQFSPAGSPANCGQIGSGFVTPSIVCSSNGGTSWSAPLAIGAGDRPRVAVGRDGTVYVTYQTGSSIMLRRFSSCSTGLVPQPPVTVAAGVTEVACPMAGLDRCNSFSSPMVAPDEQNANHVYLGYAINTSSTNDNVLVRESTNGGISWSPAVTLNTPVTARRFMPWTCSVCGTAQAGWYDRRAASPSAVDLTDFFRGSASVQLGGLTAGAEVNVTNAPDPQCATGFPCTVDNPGGSELCNAQPQLGGACVNGTGGGSFTPCDFSSTVCPAGESCAALGGCPKYGDYNGIACGFGRVYTAWASATPPAGVAGTGAGLRIFSNVARVCPLPQIQVPGDLALGDTCVGAATFGTLNVCNTGNADLEISAITSSNPRFSVTVPSSGYPVTLSPTSCFPFQVAFHPTVTGPQSATLTIPSNDPTTPSAVVHVTSSGTEPDVRVTGSTDFGTVSAWAPGEKTVSVCNTGACDLSVSSATVSCPDFTLITNPFPAIVSHDSCLDLVVRFTPVLPGSKSCTLTIASNDPDSPSVVRTLTGRTPPFFSLHAGLAVPHGALHTIATQGSTFHLDFVYPWKPKWAWDVRLGTTRFDGRAGNPDTDVYTLSANAKYTFVPSSSVRLFVNGGFGFYHFDPGRFEAGGNLGLGLNVPLGRRFALELTYNYDSAFTASPNRRFSQAQLGLLTSF